MTYRRAFQILVKRYSSTALAAAGLVIAWNVTNYVLTNYIPTYLTGTLPRFGQSSTSQIVATGIQVAVTLLTPCVIIAVGRLSDRIGRKPILITGSLALIVFGLPSVWLLRAGLPGQIIGLLIIGATLVCFAAVAPSTLPALFPTLIRYGGLAVTFNVAVSVFAGTAPTIIEAAVTTTGNLDWPGYYLVGAGVIGAISVHFIKESAGKPLAGAAPLISSADLPPPQEPLDRIP